MSEERPETCFQRELIDMNREFLYLVTHPMVGGVKNLLGMPEDTLIQLRQLSATQLDTVAGAPILLPEFVPLPGLAPFDSVADATPLPRELPSAWEREAEGFANRLLACIWQASRQNRLLTAFCIGIDLECYRQLAELSFRTISQSSDRTLSCLRFRLADHPFFWRDLIQYIRHGTEDQKTASRLAMIPLSVAHAGLPTRTTDSPRYF